MADGSRAEIGGLVVGDRVLSPVTGAAVRVARLIRGPEPERPMVALRTGAGVVLLTEQHAVPTARGIVGAREVGADDLLLTASGPAHAARSLRAPDAGVVVYNLELDTTSDRPEDHLLLAGDVVVGDWWLQERLRRAPAGLVDVLAALAR